jgi:hypothetical protein
MKFQPVLEECKTNDRKWETCNIRFTCPEGEDCWFASEEYYKEELMK